MNNVYRFIIYFFLNGTNVAVLRIVFIFHSILKFMQMWHQDRIKRFFVLLVVNLLFIHFGNAIDAYQFFFEKAPFFMLCDSLRTRELYGKYESRLLNEISLEMNGIDGHHKIRTVVRLRRLELRTHTLGSDDSNWKYGANGVEDEWMRAYWICNGQTHLLFERKNEANFVWRVLFVWI